MKKRLENPELDQLVAELNTPSSRDAETAALGPEHLDAVELLEDRTPLGSRRVDVLQGPLASLLELMVSRGASDLLLVTGRPPVLRIDGDLVVTNEDAATAVQLEERFAPFLGPRHLRDLERRGAADFTIRLVLTSGEQWRFRVNLHRQSGQPAAAIRALAQRIPTLEELDLPPEIHELAELRQGLLLVCGPTGAGKSSTLAALVGIINRRRRAHVIAIEDPLEFVHEDVRCLIEHVEIGHDAPSYAEALRAALRQDPDVILVGEMRDLETIATAVTAAETGHLILSTLHSPDSVQAIHRMVDVFPAEAKTQVRHQLALSLRAILAQELVPRLDGRGRVPAVELLKATHPVRHMIRSEKLDRLYNELVLGRRHGMLTFEQSLADLVRTGIVGEEEARLRARRPDELDSLLRG